MRRTTILLALSWTLIAARFARAGDGASPADLPLFGFEPPDVDRLVTAIKAKTKDGADKDGRQTLTVGRDYVMQPWTLYKGQASRGEWAMGLAKVSDPAKPSAFATPVNVP